MKYLEISFDSETTEEYIFDLLAEELAGIGFDSFENDTFNFKAYIQENKFDRNKLTQLLENFEFAPALSFSILEIEPKDWNKVWEKNFFQPIIIDDKCVIHSSFHNDVPEAEYDIVIDPKMAFGTGHHETTGLIIRYILDSDFKDKMVLDMGCGTSILAILARMRGAKSVLAVDIDDWCTRNSLENIALNKIDGIDVELGDAGVLKGKRFDVILANINRNILLNDISHYAQCLPSGGELYMSGFYLDDIRMVDNEAVNCGLTVVEVKDNNRWAAIKTIKL